MVPGPEVFRSLCTELERRIESDGGVIVPNLALIFDPLSSLSKSLGQKLDKVGKVIRETPEATERTLRAEFDIRELVNGIRRFLRELPDPLIPSTFYEEFMEIGKCPIDSDALLRMEKLIIKDFNPHHST